MTFVKGQKHPNQGGWHGLFTKVGPAKARYEEKQRKKAEAKLSPDERLKLQLERELEDVQFRADVLEEQVAKCGASMQGIVDSLKEMASKYNLRIENGLIESYEVSSPAEALQVRETFESLKRQSNVYQREFNQILSERAGLANRILELQMEILQVAQRIQDSQMTVQ